MAIGGGRIGDVYPVAPSRPLKPVNSDTPKRPRKDDDAEAEREEKNENSDKDNGSIIDEYA
jgi:hypothetical protein